MPVRAEWPQFDRLDLQLAVASKFEVHRLHGGRTGRVLVTLGVRRRHVGHQASQECPVWMPHGTGDGRDAIGAIGDRGVQMNSSESS